MKQPLFSLHDEVYVTVKFHADTGHAKIDKVLGRVVGLWYDPANLTQGWPYYKYRVYFRKLSTTKVVSEEDLERTAND